MLRTLDRWNEVEKLRDRGALFVVSHSGGKDSQAMYLALRKVVPQDQILVIYAKLEGDVVWKENWEHIKNTVEPGTRCLLSKAVHRDGSQATFWTLLDMRKRFPGEATRWCTSDLKTGPINRDVRRAIKKEGLSKLVVMCLGLRAEESKRRASEAKTPTLALDKNNSKAGREWYRYCPIKSWDARQVFAEIEEAGQEPHWVYKAGCRRCSCCFCLYLQPRDMLASAKLRPAVFERYVAEEKRLGFTLKRDAGLEEYAGITVAEAYEANARIKAGLECADTPVGLANPYGWAAKGEDTDEPCDDFEGSLEPVSCGSFSCQNH